MINVTVTPHSPSYTGNKSSFEHTRGCGGLQEVDIYHRLKVLTDKLHRLVDEKQGNLVDPGVLAVSQEMDRLIVHIQRSRLRVLKT